MNMKDYCRVVDRVHADAKCKEVILSDAVMASVQKLPARKPMLGGFSLYVTGAAACLMLLFCGAFLWKLGIDGDEFVQMSSPDVVDVSGDSEPAETMVTTQSETTAQTATTTQTTAAQTTTTAQTMPVQSETSAKTASAASTTALALAEKTETTAQTGTTSAAPKQTAAAATTTSESKEPETTTETTKVTLSESEEEQEIIAALQAFVEPFRSKLYQNLDEFFDAENAMFDADTSEIDASISVPWAFLGFGCYDTFHEIDDIWYNRTHDLGILAEGRAEDKKQAMYELMESGIKDAFFTVIMTFLMEHNPTNIHDIQLADIPADLTLYTGKVVYAWDPPSSNEIPDGCYSPYDEPIIFYLVQDDGRIDLYLI